ncbi:unnamed protein product [Callosobruchus maculatus]|uniref:Calcineurin-like phosphoesterase domain-containing protein n=1 Tax=Callosobruchus maculatus TaxID=64391 RepID=A0A653BSK4_CALMS|nr:unnamed protein product [Callosobruchus maculatus]
MGNSTVEVHPLTDNPTEAWKSISKEQTIVQLNVAIPSLPVAPDQVRVVCMSDTHVRKIGFDVPDGDVFIHAGDFSNIGDRPSIIFFNQWIGALPHKHKIVIAGNWELTFDKRTMDHFKLLMQLRGRKVVPADTINIRQYLTNCTYLEDSSIEVYGVKIYGSPWIPERPNGAFSLKRGNELLSKWNKIPTDTDILVTHTPPVGHGDLTLSGVRAGCVELLNTVRMRVRPKYHIFGHIHEGYGVTNDGEISFINASTCDRTYNAVNLPIVFDMPLKDGYQK